MKLHLLKLLFAALVASTCASAGAHSKDTKPPAAVKKQQQGWGIAGDVKAAQRTIDVGMNDQMRFTPERIDVKLGETIRFVTRNSGKLMHEFVIGTKAENDKHAELMLKFPTMEHDEPWMAHVPPGQTGELVWTFNRAGEFHFACLIAGHYQAGMMGKITVIAPR